MDTESLKLEPKVSGPLLTPQEIDQLVSKITTGSSLLKKCVKDKLVLTRQVEELREKQELYKDDGVAKECAVRHKKTLEEQEMALKALDGRLVDSYKSLIEAISSGYRVKYRTEYKYAVKLLSEMDKKPLHLSKHRLVAAQPAATAQKVEASLSEAVKPEETGPASAAEDDKPDEFIPQ